MPTPRKKCHLPCQECRPRLLCFSLRWLYLRMYAEGMKDRTDESMHLLVAICGISVHTELHTHSGRLDSYLVSDIGR